MLAKKKLPTEYKLAFNINMLWQNKYKRLSDTKCEHQLKVFSSQRSMSNNRNTTYSGER